jgi:signal transduction histidine kinase
MGRLIKSIVSFRENPEDPSRIIGASGRQDEIGVAERELAAMQRDLYASLQQKTRLAALGTAVARIQHDLRNILSNAQLASDKLSELDDPVVKRLAPRLVGSIDRAVSLATRTLRYGRAAERPPERSNVALEPLIDEAIEAGLAPISGTIETETHVDKGLCAYVDGEQMFRIILNLVRNGGEAIALTGKSGTIRVNAVRQRGQTIIDVCDTGPGVPPALREKLFQPFSGANKNGSGLGLAIARELARAHGGDVTLFASSGEGTVFRVTLPDVGDN